jgi:hypothetical protein
MEITTKIDSIVVTREAGIIRDKLIVVIDIELVVLEGLWYIFSTKMEERG